MLQHYDVFNENHIINISDRHQLSESEKQQILGKYLMQNHSHNTEKHEKETISESSSSDIPPTSDQVMKIASKHSNAVGYPSTCVMFSTIPEFRQQGKQFFKYCDLRIGNELANKIKDTADAVCCIFYAMLRDRLVDLNNTDKELLKQLWKLFNVKEQSMEAISKTMNKLRSTYFTMASDDRYYLKHTAVYESALRNWYAQRPELLVDLCSINIIKNNIRGDGYKPMPGETILIAKDQKVLSHLTKRFSQLIEEHSELASHPLIKEGKVKLASLKRQEQGTAIEMPKDESE